MTVHDVAQSIDKNKQSESSMFHKMYCNTGTHPEGMTRVVPKSDPPGYVTNTIAKQIQRGSILTDEILIEKF